MTREDFFLWAEKRYGTVPDYPWNDNNAVLRHKDSKKWYAAVLEVRKDRLGLGASENVYVLNIKCSELMKGSLLSQPGFHPAYHMNKEKWISIRLDGSASDEDIKSLTAVSYELTAAKKKQRKKINT